MIGYYMAALAACVVSMTFLALGTVHGSHKQIGFAFSMAMIALGAIIGSR